MPGRKKTDAKRDEILAAATEEFARRDFHEVLMEDVAARAGVGKGTLYRYFADKEGLFVAALLRELVGSQSEYLAMFAEDAPLEEVLEQMVSRMVEYFRGKEELLTLLQRYEHRLPEPDAKAMRQRRDEAITAIAGALTREVKAGRLRPLETRMAAEMLLGMVRTAVLYRREHRVGIDRTAKEVVSLFLGGVRAERAVAVTPVRVARRVQG